MGPSQSNQGKKDADHKQGLGPEIAKFSACNQHSKRVIGLASGGLTILVSIIFFILRFSEMITTVSVHGRAVFLLHAPALILWLALFPLGMIILLITGLNWNNHLTLYERGLAVHRGLRKRIWYWERTTRLDTRITHIKFGGNIVDIRIKLILGNPHEMLVIRNRFTPMSDLVQLIRSKLLPILAEWAEDQLHQNKPLVFHTGLVAVKTGLEIHGRKMRWGAIEGPKLKGKKLILLKSQAKEKLFQVNVNEITNLDLLVYLIKYPPKTTF